ncbi:unnamed protein product [Ostreobium quekettii]|uniref:Protein kinase domain-containing protein n=1 Tax=Ostreobium quekettii TaxID=121088 RepID=A0A8S1J3Q4_9CHLO|nr:unnamed protein product [Ostreobium quekettii]
MWTPEGSAFGRKMGSEGGGPPRGNLGQRHHSEAPEEAFVGTQVEPMATPGMDDIVAAINRAATKYLPHVRYNAGMLQFMHKQLETTAQLHHRLPAHMMDGEMNILATVVAEAVLLIERHAESFNYRRFYKVDFVHSQVEEICRTLAAICEGTIRVVGGPDVETVIDANCVEKDRRHLVCYLTCILAGTLDVDLDEETQHELAVCIQENMQRMDFLNIGIRAEDIQIKEAVGEGAYGQVFKGKWRDSAVAVKCFPPNLNIEARVELLNEVEMHTKMHFPNVVICWGAIFSRTQNAIVMELAEHDLQKFCWTQGSALTWAFKVCLLASAALGLGHLHDSGIVHRDVKPGNFLVFRDSSAPHGHIIKIGDFGLAMAKEQLRSKSMRNKVGTVQYMAPEVQKGQPHSFASDVFSFGVLLYELAAESDAYRGVQSEPMLLMWKLQGRDPCFVGRDCPEELRDLAKACVIPQHELRPPMTEVVRRLKKIRQKVLTAGTEELVVPKEGKVDQSTLHKGALCISAVVMDMKALLHNLRAELARIGERDGVVKKMLRDVLLSRQHLESMSSKVGPKSLLEPLAVAKKRLCSATALVRMHNSALLGTKEGPSSSIDTVKLAQMELEGFCHDIHIMQACMMPSDAQIVVGSLKADEHSNKEQCQVCAAGS